MTDYNRIRAEAKLRAEQSGHRNIGKDNIRIPDFLSVPKPPERPEPPKRPEPHPIPKKQGLLSLLNLDRIDMDADRSVILMLLAILSSKDKDADDLLILALLYIML